jgi:hypothetical protein
VRASTRSSRQPARTSTSSTPPRFPCDVRYLGAWLADDEGEEAEGLTTDDGLETGGQHQVLGWHLDREVIELLLGLGAGLDVDE